MSTKNNNNATINAAFYGKPMAPTSARPSHPQAGDVYYNNGTPEIWNGAMWVAVISSASPTFNSTQVATTQYVNSMLSGQATLNGKNGKSVSVDEIIDFMEVMKKRMLILTPVFEKHEQYPALLEAYENYLMIERLCCGDDTDEE
jgi:hypothetical protein